MCSSKVRLSVVTVEALMCSMTADCCHLTAESSITGLISSAVIHLLPHNLQKPITTLIIVSVYICNSIIFSIMFLRLYFLYITFFLATDIKWSTSLQVDEFQYNVDLLSSEVFWRLSIVFYKVTPPFFFSWLLERNVVCSNSQWNLTLRNAWQEMHQS